MRVERDNTGERKAPCWAVLHAPPLLMCLAVLGSGKGIARHQVPRPCAWAGLIRCRCGWYLRCYYVVGKVYVAVRDRLGTRHARDGILVRDRAATSPGSVRVWTKSRVTLPSVCLVLLQIA